MTRLCFGYPRQRFVAGDTMVSNVLKNNAGPAFAEGPADNDVRGRVGCVQIQPELLDLRTLPSDEVLHPGKVRSRHVPPHAGRAHESHAGQHDSALVGEASSGGRCSAISKQYAREKQVPNMFVISIIQRNIFCFRCVVCTMCDERWRRLGSRAVLLM